MTPTVSEPKNRLSSAAIGVCVLVLAVSGAVLWGVTQGGFLTDDALIIERILFGSEKLPGEEPDASQVFEVFFDGKGGRHQVFRPATVLTFAANLAFTGVAPRPFMITNLALHLLSGAALYFLLLRLLPSRALGAAAVATAWYLMSPIQVESFTWIAARSESLVVLFGLSALLVKLHRPERHLVPGIFALIALFAKESALIFPLLLLAMEFTPKTDSLRSRSRVKSFLAACAPIGIYLAVRSLAFDGLGLDYANRGGDDASLIDLGASMGRSLTMGLFPVSSELLDNSVISSALVFQIGLGAALLLIIGGALFTRPKLRPLLAALLIGTGLFALPFVMATALNEIAPTLANSRGFTVPMAGLSIFVAIGLRQLARPLAVLAASLLLIPTLCLIGPTLDVMVSAQRETRITLDSMRQALATVPDDVKSVAVLGFQPEQYLRGSFTLRGGLSWHLGPAFGGQTRRVLSVRNDAHLSPGFVHFSALKRNASSMAFLAAVPPFKAPRRYEALHFVAESARSDGEVSPLDPKDVLTLKTEFDEPQSIPFRFTYEGPQDQRFELRVLIADGRLFSGEIAATHLRREGAHYVFDLPVGLDVAPQLQRIQGFAWTVALLNADGQQIGHSPLSFVTLQWSE